MTISDAISGMEINLRDVERLHSRLGKVLLRIVKDT